MKVRECYEQFIILPQPDREPRRFYKAVLTTWERFSGDPDVQEIDGECLMSFKKKCHEAGLMTSACNNCWGYIRAILKAAAGNGVTVPYLNNRWDSPHAPA